MKKTQFFLLLGMALLALPMMAQPNDVEMNDPKPGSQEAWQNVRKVTLGWGTIDERYSRSQVPTFQKKLSLRAWRGERVSAQALLVAPEGFNRVSFTVSDLKSGKNVIAAENIRKYFVRYVMTDEFKNAAGEGHCGARERTRMDSSLVADRLDPAASLKVEAHSTRPLWLDIRVPQSATPGKYTGTLTVNCDGQELKLPYSVEVTSRTLPAPKDWTYHLDLWQNPYAVARYYNVPLWSKEHFDYMRPIMTMLAEAGQKVITASVIQHPWASQTQDPFESMITKMKTIEGKWQYNYDVFDRWVEFMISCGVTRQIDCYTLVPWSYSFDYYDMASNSVKFIACKPGSKEYEDLIHPFLTDFAKHLKSKGWFDRTCIAMDERPMEQLRAAYEVVKRADPGYRIEGAANYYPEVEPMMYDLSVTFEHPLLDEKVLEARRKAGRLVTFYTCCGPDRPNTFTFSEPAESAFLAWHAMAAGYDGYLRWAYNSWTIQPNQDSRFRSWSAGDCFVVYPGCSSIRMERMVQGIQDFEKIKILKKTATPQQLTKLNAVLEKFRPNVFDPEQKAAMLVNEGQAFLKTIE